VSVVAIHQPTFFPWLGYFDKIARSDVFVFLDSVQASKTGGSWLNRVRLAVNGEARWVTAPIDRSYHGVRLVKEIEFGSTPWRDQVTKTLTSAYGRAAHYGETMQLIEPLILNPDNNLARFNHAAVMAIVSALKLDLRRFVMSSTLGLEGQNNDLLAAITRAVGGDTYLCGGGASEYFDEPPFADAGIEVRYQNFQHPQYGQPSGQMIAGLSVIDALMHCGSDVVAGWLTAR
jgi:hypothetical protein